MIVFADAPALSDPPRTERPIGPAQGFAVTHFMEVLVELPDSHQPFGRMDCHNMVPLLDQLAHHFLVHDRRSDRGDTSHAGDDIHSSDHRRSGCDTVVHLSLIHISEPTRLGMISYAVFCLKK